MLNWIAGPGKVPRLGRPFALTEDSRGRLILTDPEQGLVHLLDFERQRHLLLKGPKREPFISPVGVAVDGRDRIYVTDSARARIRVFGRNGKLRGTFGQDDKQIGFKRPTGIAIDANAGILYVTDTGRHQVLALNLKGRLLRVIGRRGSGPGEFNFPTAIALAGNEIYVVDAMNFRVQAFTLEGEYLRSFGGQGNRTGTLNRPKGIAADSRGNLYIVDALFEAVQVFDRDGRLLYYFGAGGQAEGEFSLPGGIYIGPRDRIYVADTMNGRVQVFQLRTQER